MAPNPIEVVVAWVPVISAKHGDRVLNVELVDEVRPLAVTMRIDPGAQPSAVGRTALYTAEDLGAWIVDHYLSDLCAALTAAQRASLR